jgi:hypothetical protein
LDSHHGGADWWCPGKSARAARSHPTSRLPWPGEAPAPPHGDRSCWLTQPARTPSLHHSVKPVAWREPDLAVATHPLIGQGRRYIWRGRRKIWTGRCWIWSLTILSTRISRHCARRVGAGKNSVGKAAVWVEASPPPSLHLRGFGAARFGEGEVSGRRRRGCERQSARVPLVDGASRWGPCPAGH